ncbi:MAG: von Willebrand factor type A domain-containing protein [Bacteroidales bacterium]|nr:von Willebrand factor type A domain-containing protein [Bacteroidales bacterium]
MKKNVFLILISLFALNFNLRAQIITGTVIDKETKEALPGAAVIRKSIKNIGTSTDIDGKYSIRANENDILVFSCIGYKTIEVKVLEKKVINIEMEQEQLELDEIVVVAYGSQNSFRHKSRGFEQQVLSFPGFSGQKYNTEDYAIVNENGYKETIKAPLSTFSIDVDAASYSNVRRFLKEGQKPPVDAVRIEEMINYFNYDYPEPREEKPFEIYQETASCPWNSENVLLHIGLQAKKVKMDNLPASNIVFLIDVSGSMDEPNKLPLLKKSFKMLIQQLRKKDKVAIVVYAGNSGLVLPSTSCDEKQKIVAALEKLNAGGSTAGAAGLELAYKVARENFIPKGNNRIILATDGDFNVGISSNSEMERLIEKERKNGIFISVLGFGMGNYKDSKMEIIADKGNGNYSYIDNLLEAKKVLVNEFGGTLFTIAKDVKIQVEFNPQIVESYRLIGYENRMLNNEDFENDKKDAGELGSGHTVTALYEIKLTSKNSSKQNKLRYQSAQTTPIAKKGNEIATIKFRYKKPEADKSILIEKTIPYKKNSLDKMSDNFKFSAAVASFGMLLRNSEYKGKTSFDSIINMAAKSKGDDNEGYRSEFIQLVKLAKHL